MLPRTYFLAVVALAVLAADAMPPQESSNGQKMSSSRQSTRTTSSEESDSSMSTSMTSSEETEDSNGRVRGTSDDEKCAPCDEINFRGMDRNVQCLPEVIQSESFKDCRMICENALMVDDEETSPGKSKSRRTLENIESCRCLCKSLHLNAACKERNVCNRRFNEVRCPSESLQLAQPSTQRCFERGFKDEDTYNGCVASTDRESLAPPMATTEPPAEQDGVEQCTCTCSFNGQRRGPTDATTVAMTTVAVTTAPEMDGPCSENYDCSLTLRQQRKIERRLDGDEGNSLDECRSNCEAEFVETRQDKSSSRGHTQRSGRSDSSSSSISSSDCECYCLMFHDPCSQEQPTTTTETEDSEQSRSTGIRTKSSKTRSKSSKTSKQTTKDRSRSPIPRTRSGTDRREDSDDTQPAGTDMMPTTGDNAMAGSTSTAVPFGTRR